METQKKARRGGRPTKPATPGQRAVLGLRVTAKTKTLLDGAKASGRTQAQEAERLIELGCIFEQFGRFTLPPELQQLAVELVTAHSGGPYVEIHHRMQKAKTEEERELLWHAYYSALLSYRRNFPLAADAAKIESQQQPDPASDEAA